MATPSQKIIDSERLRVKNLKASLESRFKVIFREWQIKAFNDFVSQAKSGLTLLILDSEISKELGVLLKEHYWEVAETFVPGLVTPEIKQSFSGVSVETGEEEEDRDFEGFLIPTVLRNIQNTISDQIGLQFPVHHSSIIGTTNRIANDALTMSRQPGASFIPILTSKLVARETTVAITETDWIAEASTNSALEMTTPAIAIATPAELNALQKISPNITLRETDINELFIVSSISTIDSWRRELTTPQKMWVDVGDNRVRSTHRAINGVIRDVNQPFILPGGLLMFPADSSLGVAFREIVNCRCFALYF